MGHYTLRYVAGVPLKERKHAICVPMYPTYGDADDARQRAPQPDHLEVVRRWER